MVHQRHLWHHLSVKEVEKILGTNIQTGLSEKEVKLRRKFFGKNKLPEEKPLSKFEIFLNQFKSPLVYILLIAGIITIVVGNSTDAIVIFLAVFLNALVGYFQEYKANHTLQELKKILKQKTIVLRESRQKEILQEELVPGDIVILKEGNKTPADGRVFESHNLKISEAVLTGEGESIEKIAKTLPQDIPLADRKNMVYMGTIVEEGEGKCIVTETGPNTELGKIAQYVKASKTEKTPYQKKLTVFTRVIAIIIAILCLLIIVEGVARARDFVEIFITAVAVAVAAIPESLPVAMTVILALGMRSILKRKGLVRKLASAETLGSASIIATDKTLTLTEGKMKLDKIFSFDEDFALKIGAFCNEAFIENPNDPPQKWRLKGNPTEKAILKGALQRGMAKSLLTKEFEKIDIIPFNSKNKFLATLQKKDEEFFIFVSGAPENIIQKSEKILKAKNEIVKVNKENLLKKNSQMAQQGLRTVAVAFKKITPQEIKNWKQSINQLIFVGIFGLKDPIRKEAKSALEICKKAGLRIIIVTGDHLLTAQAVARELGIDVSKDKVMVGEELEKISDEELKKKIEKINLFARVEPFHKLKIIRAWQEKNEVIAMTGDGINDAPALKKADIGIALGSGTDVAKETSDLILLNDNFNVIVAAVEEGRAILDNIRKVITFLLSDSFTEVILVSASLIFNWPLPILAPQILWVNILEDGPLGMALAFEPKEKDLMKKKPEKLKAPLLTREMKVIIFIMGLTADLILLGFFIGLLYLSNYSIHHIRSFMTAGLAIGSFFYVFSCKSLRKQVWQTSIFSNKFLNLSLIFSILMLILGLYFPPFQTILKTQGLTFLDWIMLCAIGITNMGLVELGKRYFIKKREAL